MCYFHTTNTDTCTINLRYKTLTLRALDLYLSIPNFSTTFDKP